MKDQQLDAWKAAQGLLDRVWRGDFGGDKHHKVLKAAGIRRIQRQERSAQPRRRPIYVLKQGEYVS
jgi:hypothetical protein